LAELDFLQGTTIYAAVFRFKDTQAFSATFEQYEMGDLNFFMNTGSLMVITFMLFLNFFFWITVFYVSKCFYRVRCCRKLAMSAQEKGILKKPLLSLFVETYIDIIFAASLNYYAIS
jgi:hypothetical protein